MQLDSSTPADLHSAACNRTVQKFNPSAPTSCGFAQLEIRMVSSTPVHVFSFLEAALPLLVCIKIAHESHDTSRVYSILKLLGPDYVFPEADLSSDQRESCCDRKTKFTPCNYCSANAPA